MEQRNYNNENKNIYTQVVKTVMGNKYAKIAIYGAITIGAIYIASLGLKVLSFAIKNAKEVTKALKE